MRVCITQFKKHRSCPREKAAPVSQAAPFDETRVDGVKLSDEAGKSDRHLIHLSNCLTEASHLHKLKEGRAGGQPRSI